MNETAEKFNGKAAMIGIFALKWTYYFTSQIVLGNFFKSNKVFKLFGGVEIFQPFFFNY